MLHINVTVNYCLIIFHPKYVVTAISFFVRIQSALVHSRMSINDSYFYLSIPLVDKYPQIQYRAVI